MPTDWSRRAVLAGLGAVALAGCVSGQNGSDSTPTGSTPPSGTPTATETPADEQTATETSGSGSATETPATPTEPERVDAGWPLPDYDPGRSNYTREAAGPTDRVERLWRLETDTSLSPPVLAEGTLYVGGDDGVVRAVDARNGEKRWETSVSDRADTPQAVDGRLVVPTAGAVVALDTSDGTEVWRTETPDRVALQVATHGVYWLAGRGDPAVVALTREDGSERWRTGIRDPWEAYPFASDGSVFVSTGPNNGRPWTFDPESGDIVGRRPEMGHDFPAERFYLDGTVVGVDAFFGTVRALSVEPGGDGWSAGVDGLGNFAISGGRSRVYYVADGGERPGLYAISRSNGEVEWHTDAVSAVVGRPVVAGEAVLVRGDGALYCFDPADGSELWSRPADGVGDRFVVADDLLYTTRDGTLGAFRPP